MMWFSWLLGVLPLVSRARRAWRAHNVSFKFVGFPHAPVFFPCPPPQLQFESHHAPSLTQPQCFPHPEVHLQEARETSVDIGGVAPCVWCDCATDLRRWAFMFAGVNVCVNWVCECDGCILWNEFPEEGDAEYVVTYEIIRQYTTLSSRQDYLTHVHITLQ